MENLTGKLLHFSWGYNMTHNDWAKIVEDKGGATVKAVRIGQEIIDGGGYTGNEKPLPGVEHGAPFRLYKRSGWKGETCFVGSYPIQPTRDPEFKHRGIFSICGTEARYYNTVD